MAKKKELKAPIKVDPIEQAKAVLIAEQKKQQACWDEANAVFEKHGYSLIVFNKIDLQPKG